MRKLLLPVLVGLWLLAGCGGARPRVARRQAGDDAAFATELMHRDAALLNLLDVALGRDLDPRVAATGEQLRFDANERMATGGRAARGVGREGPRHLPRPRRGAQQRQRRARPRRRCPPATTYGGSASSTGRRSTTAYVALLTTALEATREFADAHEPASDQADELAQAAVVSSSTALDAL